MNRQANGIGNYKRTRPMQYAAPISDESRARMDAAHRICQERASPGVMDQSRTPEQAAAVYRNGQAGLTQATLEVTA